MPAVATATQAKAEEATRTGRAMAESHELGPAAGAPGQAGSVLGLQRAIGNRAVDGVLQRKCCGKAGGMGGRECAECKGERESGDMQRMALLRAPVGIQAKLTINEPGDRFEQEADQVAEMVAGGGAAGAPTGSATGRGYGAARDVSLQRLGSGGAGAVAGAGNQAAPPVVHDVLRSAGQPLDGSTRAFMEPRFGQDFGAVRVHTDARATESARAVNAVAYTVGRDVVFGAGRYAPGTGEGRRLLAHELAHVVQQGDTHAPAAVQRQATLANSSTVETPATASGGPYICADPESMEGKSIGDGHCVKFVQACAGAPRTASWEEGTKVQGSTGIAKGTVIATFEDGKYPNRSTGNHAAVYMSHDEKGIVVYDQWKGQPVHSRVIRFRNGKTISSNDGSWFSVVM